ncbi:MAG TPA: replicative DNA helicase [Rectinemataceae bacterium]|nr:replicative DNA helicase [Rectinemataceae bacterium]
MIPVQLKDKVPPHNAEAEQACLGAVLLDPEAVPEVLRFLRPEDFYVNANREVFAGIISLYEKGQKADLITLTDEMRLLGSLEHAGGPGYVANLTSVTPSSANVEYYAKIVQETSIRRNLLKLSAEIGAKAHEDSMESGMILDEAQAKIFEITQNRQSVMYKSVKELLPETIKTIEKLFKNKNAYTGIPSGLPDLDSMTSGFQDSEFIVIGARPSVGKTALALSMAAHIAVKERISCAFFSLEMADMAIMQRLISSEARISSEKIRSGLIKPSDFNALMEAAGRIYEAPLYIMDMPNMKLLDLRTMARRLRSERDVKIIFIDYLTLITHENSDLPRWEQIASISRSLKALARELRIPVVALSQLKREAEGKQPTLADLRESGSIEQDADVILFLHRDRETNKTRDERSPVVETELIIAKQRNGPVGKVEIAFLPSYTRFESIEKRMS